MESIREYLLGVVAAALVCSVALRLKGKGAAATVIRLVCGMYMLLSVVSPWLNIRGEEFFQLQQDVAEQAERYCEEGKMNAQFAVEKIIMQQTQSYILNKAASYGANLTVEVRLQDGQMPVPCGVTLRGSISPYGRQEMQRYIENTLGIKLEEQEWIIS